MGFFAALAPVIGGIGGALIGSSSSSSAANKAADAQVRGAQIAADSNERMFNRSIDLLAPSIHYGNEANALLAMNAAIPRYDTTPQARDSELVSQVGVPGLTDPTAAAYLDQRPGLASAMARDAARFGRSIDELVHDHYTLHGRAEGLLSPQDAVKNYRASSQVPGLTAGAGQPGTIDGQAGGNALSPQDQFYNDHFMNSGEYRSMLETTEADMDRYTGQFGAAGKAVSGSHLAALNDLNRRNTNNAFQQFTGGLRSMAGQGQVATQQGASGAMQLGNTLGNLALGTGNARASSYLSQGQANQNALSGIAGALGGADWKSIVKGAQGLFG